MSARKGTEINDRYLLEEPIGAGGMATVWRARDLRLGRDVALKLIADKLLDQQDFIDRFRREARIAAGLSHPNLVSVHDLGFFGERPFLVMELINGETLGARLDRNEEIDAVELAKTLLDVLAKVHDAGIVHRDIKPGNVLYQDDGRILLTDFGIARIVDTGDSAPPTSITQSGVVIGTSRYMAPEVRSGAVPTPSADLYSLGVTLAQCGAADGPLGPLITKLRRADPAQRPPSARLAAVSIAGIESFATRPTERSPISVLDASGNGVAAPDDDPTPTPVVAEPATPAPPGPADRPAEPAERTVHAASAVPTRLIAAVVGGIAVIAAAALLVGNLSGSGDEGGSGSTQASSSAAGDAKSKDKGKDKPDKEPAPQPEPAATPAPVAPEPDTEPAAETGTNPDEGFALNAQGYELLQAGDAEAAVPILEQAVAAYPEDSEDINYAYALFNLGSALNQSGRPEEAIPYLERRLDWPNQRATVERELAAARAAIE